MLHIYYGMGKGKTSTLNGSAIRAKAVGMKVGLFRFLKGRKTNEDESLRQLGIDVKKFHGSPKFVIEMNDDEKVKAKREAELGMQYILSNKDKYDMILLDEFIDLLDATVNFFNEQQLIDFLVQLNNKEVLVSGHSKYKEIFKIADLITYYKPEKHYFDQGVLAREGIEF